MLTAAPVFLSILKFILSHIARYVPSNKLQNSLKIQVQNCGTYSFTIAKSHLKAKAKSSQKQGKVITAERRQRYHRTAGMLPSNGGNDAAERRL